MTDLPAAREEVPPGYKRTEAGVIPEGWKVTRLGNLANVMRGASPRPIDSSKWFDEYSSTGWLRISDITAAGKYVTETAQSLSAEGIANSRFVMSGNLVMSICATVGRPVITRKDVCIHDGFVVFDHLQTDNEYLYYTLANIEADWPKHGQTGSQTNLNTEIIRSKHIPLPPLPEQRAIAAALSDVDRLIGALDALIEKKRAIKQAAMQQLLTGRTRLPGFEGEWRNTTLGQLIENCSSGATPYRGRPEYYKGNIKWITSGELEYGQITDTKEHISEEAVRKTNLKLHPPGTFLMAITGLEAEGTRGSCGIVGAEAATNQSCMAIYPNCELCSEYLFHFYVLRGKTLALQYCQGTKQQSYTAKTVKLLPIRLPVDIDEQHAISAVLSDMDTEIAALERRRQKTEQIKQGMMQQLLTGRIRLIEPPEAAA